MQAIDTTQAPRLVHSTPTLWQRIGEMALLWLAIGCFVGIGTAPRLTDVIGVISGIIAGTIVLVPVGVLQGLMGGRARTSVWGGTAGVLIGSLTAWIGGTGTWHTTASVGLLGGAMIGATIPIFYLYLNRIRRAVLALTFRASQA